MASRVTASGVRRWAGGTAVGGRDGGGRAGRRWLTTTDQPIAPGGRRNLRIGRGPARRLVDSSRFTVDFTSRGESARPPKQYAPRGSAFRWLVNLPCGAPAIGAAPPGPPRPRPKPYAGDLTPWTLRRRPYAGDLTPETLRRGPYAGDLKPDGRSYGGRSGRKVSCGMPGAVRTYSLTPCKSIPAPSHPARCTLCTSPPN
jgi:hypothetical protein